MEKYKDRKFMLLLYPDNDSHVKALEHIQMRFEKYAYILHDKDTNESGELNKPHYHVVVNVGKSAIWNTSLAKELGIDVKFCGGKIRSFNNALEYLVHMNDKDKYQYPLDEVKGSLVDKVFQLVNYEEKSEGDRVLELIKYIEEYDGFLSLSEFLKYCAKNGYWDVCRRADDTFVKLIDEHNAKLILDRSKG